MPTPCGATSATSSSSSSVSDFFIDLFSISLDFEVPKRFFGLRFSRRIVVAWSDHLPYTAPAITKNFCQQSSQLNSVQAAVTLVLLYLFATYVSGFRLLACMFSVTIHQLTCSKVAMPAFGQIYLTRQKLAILSFHRGK